MLDEDDVDRLIEEEFDPRILKDDLVINDDGLPPATLDRIGDIKAALIDFSHHTEFMEDFEAARQLTEQVGKNLLTPENVNTGEAVAIHGTLSAKEEKSIELPPGTSAIRALSIKLGNYDDP